MHRNPHSPLSVPLAKLEETFGITLDVARERYARLTRRERQVADLMATGKANRDIAAELGVTTKTLDIHRNSVKIKLNARTAAGIANLVNLVRLTESV